MTATTSGRCLPERLRELRTSQWQGVVVTQRQLAEALGVSVPMISSWESMTAPALPGEDRLQAYARFFATRPVEGSTPRLLDIRELTEDEERTRRELIDELVELREAALRPPSGALSNGCSRWQVLLLP
jgi:transcriptional regulator with XRE-family HTH domain